MKAPLYTRKDAPRELLCYGDWEDVDTSELVQQVKLRVSQLTEAIQLYIDGNPVSSCLEGRNLCRTQLLRAFRRCIATDRGGRQFGWRALLQYARVQRSVRTKPVIPSGRNGRGGFTGALHLLFQTNATLHDDFDRYLLSTAKCVAGYEARIRHQSAHQKFKELCRAAGLEASCSWPFNTIKEGRGAIRSYVASFLVGHYDQIVETQYGSKAKAKSKTGRGVPSRLTAFRPLDVVELDEHKCHFIGSIGFPTPGGMLWVPGERVTILVAVERTFGAILAYKAVFSREADADDVLDVLALVCGTPRERLFEAGLQPSSKAAFPVDLGGPLARCGFNQLLLDNALIHLADTVLTRVRDIIGCDVNFGPVKRFDRRPQVEATFGALERHGFHRLPSTTGTDPSDPRRQKPDEAACNLKIGVSQALDIIEACAADFNGTVSKAGFGISRMDRLKAWADDIDGIGMIFPQLPPLPNGVADLDTTLVPVTIRGNVKSGRRAYVYFEEEEYFGTDLADRWDLVGQSAFVRARRWNIRELELFHKNGMRIDTVTVRGRWSRSPAHSRDLRRTVNRAIRNGQLRVEYDEDPVHRFMENLRNSLEETKKIDRDMRKALSVVADEQKNDRRRAASAASAGLNAAIGASADDAAVESDVELLTMDDLCSIDWTAL